MLKFPVGQTGPQQKKTSESDYIDLFALSTFIVQWRERFDKLEPDDSLWENSIYHTFANQKIMFWFSSSDKASECYEAMKKVNLVKE